MAQQVSSLDGILWHHGEAEANSGKYRNYYEKFVKIVEKLRQELNVPKIPLIIGGLGDFLGTGIGQEYFNEYKQVDEELKRFAFNQKNCYYVTASGLSCNPDGIHINAVSQRVFGLRYYEAYAQKCHVLAPMKNEDKAVELDSNRLPTKSEMLYKINVLFYGGKIPFEEYQQKMSQIID